MTIIIPPWFFDDKKNEDRIKKVFFGWNHGVMSNFRIYKHAWLARRVTLYDKGIWHCKIKRPHNLRWFIKNIKKRRRMMR